MSRRATTLLLPLFVLLAGCGRDDGRAAAATVTPPPALVARGQVDVEGGTLALALPVDGVLARVQVVEGASVHRDDVLLQADDTPARLDERLAEARHEQARAQLDALQPKVAAAELHAQRLGEAARDGAADGQSADDAREAASEARAELENARAGLSLATAELDRARYQVRQQVLRAPVDGEVLRLAAWPGMRVASGTPLLTLLPRSARIVRAELSQDALVRVGVDDEAQVLSDDGRQTPLARARVLRVGRTFGQSVLQGDPTQRVNERSVECVLALEPPQGLRVGQRVLVRFDAERPRQRVAKGR
jgi:multidrug efflux pump subunit AcrA (membrane-fusion protein)